MGLPVPKQWDEAYLREAFADEIELARVKLRHKVSMPRHIDMETTLTPDAPRYGSMNARFARTTPSFPLPRWRRTWLAAGPLIGELGLEIRHDADEGTVSVGVAGGSRRRGVTEAYKDHPSRDAAVMAALVRAAIQAINEARDNA
jgi:hypothetical protein